MRPHNKLYLINCFNMSWSFQIDITGPFVKPKLLFHWQSKRHLVFSFICNIKMNRWDLVIQNRISMRISHWNSDLLFFTEITCNHGLLFYFFTNVIRKKIVLNSETLKKSTLVYFKIYFYLSKMEENVISTYISVIKLSIKTFPNDIARRAKIKIASWNAHMLIRAW